MELHLRYEMWYILSLTYLLQLPFSPIIKILIVLIFFLIAYLYSLTHLIEPKSPHKIFSSAQIKNNY